MGKAEKLVEDYLVSEVKGLGGFSRKYTSPGFIGVPDRIVFIPPFGAFFVEVKPLTGTFRKKQLREIDRINRAGAFATGLSGIDAVDQFIQEIEYAKLRS